MEEIKDLLVVFGGGQVNGKTGSMSVWVSYEYGNRYLFHANDFRVNVSTRAGRMAARAYALTYLAEEPNELRGEEVYNEIIRLIGESE